MSMIVCEEATVASECRICFSGFMTAKPRRGPIGRLCSDPCRRVAKNAHTAKHAAKARADGRYRKRERAYVETIFHEFVCVVCSSAFHTRWHRAKCCSPACTLLFQKGTRARYQAAEREAGREVACQECQKPFYRGGPKDKFCCLPCTRRARDRKFVAARRGRYAEGEMVDPMKVFERDGWRCQECRRPTPRKLRGTIDLRAPELDHIVSVADGGEHSYRNTRCTCRACNQAKGRASRGQLALL